MAARAVNLDYHIEIHDFLIRSHALIRAESRADHRATVSPSRPRRVSAPLLPQHARPTYAQLPPRYAGARVGPPLAAIPNTELISAGSQPASHSRTSASLLSPPPLGSPPLTAPQRSSSPPPPPPTSHPSPLPSTPHPPHRALPPLTPPLTPPASSCPHPLPAPLLLSSLPLLLPPSPLSPLSPPSTSPSPPSPISHPTTPTPPLLPPAISPLTPHPSAISSSTSSLIITTIPSPLHQPDFGAGALVPCTSSNAMVDACGRRRLSRSLASCSSRYGNMRPLASSLRAPL